MDHPLTATGPARVEDSAPMAPEPSAAPLAWQQRALEVVPGLLTWSIILALLFLPLLLHPIFIVPLIVLLDVYWLIRSIIVVRGIRSSFRRIRQETRVDWWQRCLDLEPTAWTDEDGVTYDPRDLYHAVLIPTYTERYEVLQATIAALAAAEYPTERKVVAVITRTSDENGIENVRRLRDEFRGRFFRFWHILDPVLPGVVVGKSAAMAWGGPVLHDHIAEEGLDPRKVIVTDLDSDFRIHPQYLARISWEYCQDHDRDYRLFQPVPMFHNNIWRVPAVVHVLASASTQWQMFLHTRPHRLVTFSSYSMSLHMVRDVGYWDPHVIQEDSRLYWRCYFRYGRRLKVRSVWLPIYGDCPRSKSYAGTHASQYNQIKRWAWGVSDVPFVFLNVMTHPEIALWDRAYRFMLLVFNHLLWVAMPVILLFGASIPGYVAAFHNYTGVAIPGLYYDYSVATISDYLGYASFGILTFTLINVAFLIYVDEQLVPPRPPEWTRWRRWKSYIEIFAYPMIALFFSVLPALESQTRLMFGRYLEYRVTAKE